MLNILFFLFTYKNIEMIKSKIIGSPLILFGINGNIAKNNNPYLIKLNLFIFIFFNSSFFSFYLSNSFLFKLNIFILIEINGINENNTIKGIVSID